MSDLTPKQQYEARKAERNKRREAKVTLGHDQKDIAMEDMMDRGAERSIKIHRERMDIEREAKMWEGAFAILTPMLGKLGDSEANR